MTRRTIDRLEIEEEASEPLRVQIQRSYDASIQKALWDRHDKRLTVREMALRKAMEKFLREQGERIAPAASKSARAAIKAADDVDWDVEDERLLKLLRKHINEAIKRGALSVRDEYGLPVDFDLSDPRVQAFLREYGAEKVTKLINEVTREKLRTLIADGREQSMTPRELAQSIRDMFDDMSVWRSENIARTEMTGALNHGVWYGYVEGGVELKAWLGQMDAYIRDSHAEATEKYAAGIPLTEAFIVGGHAMQYPGDHAAPASENCNCRCGMVPVLKE